MTGVGIIGILIIIFVIGLITSVLIHSKNSRSKNLENAVEVEPKTPSQQPVIHTEPAAPAQVNYTSQVAVPYFPALPASCTNCHAPLSMNKVNWTGPMSASCPNCGSSIDIKWTKIGG